MKIDSITGSFEHSSFYTVLDSVMASDPRVIIIDTDLSKSSGTAALKKARPSQFLNVGIAEQNAVGVACGLARIGYYPIVHSFAAFVTTRGFEMIRSGGLYQQFPICICATKGGIEAAHSGATHHSTEDLALMRLIPGLSVMAPADFNDFAVLLADTLQHNRCAYFRVPPKGQHKRPFVCTPELGRVEILQRGSRVAIIFTGALGARIQNIAKILNREWNLYPTITYMHTLQPVDDHSLEMICREHEIIATFEEHSVSGGLASIVKERLSSPSKLLSFALPAGFIYEACSYNTLFDRYCFNEGSAALKINKALLP